MAFGRLSVLLSKPKCVRKFYPESIRSTTERLPHLARVARSTMIGLERTLELLAIIESFGEAGATTEEFARTAFPNARSWDAMPKNPRRGAKPGGRMISSGAGLLGQLRSGHLVRRENGRFFLSSAGLDLLDRQRRGALDASRSAEPVAPTPHGASTPPWPPHAWPPPQLCWWDGRTVWLFDAWGVRHSVPIATPTNSPASNHR